MARLKWRREKSAGSRGIIFQVAALGRAKVGRSLRSTPLARWRSETIRAAVCCKRPGGRRARAMPPMERKKLLGQRNRRDAGTKPPTYSAADTPWPVVPVAGARAIGSAQEASLVVRGNNKCLDKSHGLPAIVSVAICRRRRRRGLIDLLACHSDLTSAESQRAQRFRNIK